MTLSAQAVAELVGGRLIGNGDLVLAAVGPLDGAEPDTLSFLASSRYLPRFRESRAGAVLLRADCEREPLGPPVRIVVEDPHGALARAVGAMFPPLVNGRDVHPTARLGPGVRLGAAVSVGPHAVVGRGVVLGDRVVLGAGVVLEDGVEVGDDTVLGPHVVCQAGTRVGRRCVIKAGAVLGGTGFGYLSSPSGHERIPHVGGVVVGDDVDIGANCCIDRGSIDDTVIGSGTRLDNLVHVGHNSRVGARCLIMGGSVLAGSADLGDGVVVAGHSAIGGHVKVGDGARIGAKSGVISPVPAGADWTGYPARPHREFLRAQAALYRLARITDELETVVAERAGGNDA
ncbi:MAG: UDP-3-O-(3-hydroxymyristoyl)glucosamine N-acyltransferase [Gemmatimonadales bacterium]